MQHGSHRYCGLGLLGYSLEQACSEGFSPPLDVLVGGGLKHSLQAGALKPSPGKASHIKGTDIGAICVAHHQFSDDFATVGACL